MIREIRRQYPDKVVAAYSGATQNQAPAQKARELADVFIKKTVDIETWVEKLDELIEIASDPRKVWKRVRYQLVVENVDSRELVRLEDAFVTDITSQDKNFSALKKISSKERIGGFASNLIQNMISGGLLHVLLN